MATTDIAPVVARMRTLIAGVPGIGRVHTHDVYSSKDLVPLITAEVSGEKVIRCWWIKGPSMTSRRAAQAGGEIERRWNYEIHGVVGLVEDGSHILTLRDLALKVADAVDADFDLGATVHMSDPTSWRVQPENRSIIAGVGVGYTMMTKTVTTLSLP